MATILRITFPVTSRSFTEVRPPTCERRRATGHPPTAAANIFPHGFSFERGRAAARAMQLEFQKIECVDRDPYQARRQDNSGYHAVTVSLFRRSSRQFSPLQCTPYSTSGREPVSGAFAFSGIVKSNCADLQAAKCLHPVPSLGSQTPGRIPLVARQIASAFAGCGKSSSGDVQAKRARTNRAAPSPKAGIHDGRQRSACALKPVSTANRGSPRDHQVHHAFSRQRVSIQPPGEG